MTAMPRNAFREKLSPGSTTYGLWLGIPDTTVAEMMAGSGFDWLVIDQEHGPYEVRDVMAQLQAIAPYDVAPVVRPVDADPGLLKKLCDVGAQTFLVPMIETAEQAADAVAAVRYPPRGIRGLGTSMARAARWNAVAGYIDRADDEMCVIVQAESAAALCNLESIAEVDGVEAVFIGPSDLSASMGHAGEVSHPEVVAAVGDGIRRIVKAGKHAGVLCLDEKLIREYTDCGAGFVGVGVDTLLIGNAARALAARCRNRQGESSPDAGY